ncbi:MAG: phospho-sugar mutase [Lachnospiraceae bacterium]|nr:phospho-sugar mutase [Lachnospiraceae bacterium]
MSYMDSYRLWLESDYFDENTKKELKAIANDEKEIEDRFYKGLQFGTGGLRGVIGAGENRMNIYTVRKATQGLANYIIEAKGQAQGVAIAYDSRIMSPEFARETALCLNANGIKTYLFPELRPTPELSFAVRHLGCIAGVVITASHNPAQYNGYKVYWEDGGQITPPHDKNIMDQVAKVTEYDMVKTMSEAEAVEAGLFHMIGEEVDTLYFDEVKNQIINPEVIANVKDLKIVYTPLHGTGLVPVTTVLKKLGFENVYVVEEQAKPDGHFPTVDYPNPEEKSAFKLALELAKEKDADIVMATDPDADRLGLFVKVQSGEYVSFNGNMIGTLIAEYILREKRERGLLPKNAALVSTIVTTDMIKSICKRYGVQFIETLTGFKYIGEQIKFFERAQSYEYMFGLEESYGCLAGTYARDKDACSAVVMLCEVAAYYKNRNMTLWDGINELYREYGAYAEELSYIVLQGKEGLERIDAIMNQLRANAPKQFGDFEVEAVRDYKTGITMNFDTGKVGQTGLPVSNVLYYELQNGAWCAVRPSGTEPKIKFYIGAKSNSLENAKKLCKNISEALLALAD